MSYASSPSPAAPPRKRSIVPWLAAGCLAAVLLLACVTMGVAGFFYYSRRPVTAASAPSVEYILDATQRMAQMADGENDTRLNVARGVLAEIVRPSDPTLTAGLRVFGSGAQAAACSDTTLLVPLAPASQGQISTHLLSINTGSNPSAAMSQAMISAIRDLARLKGKHTLVVVTGGADSCSPQAGELIAAEAKKASIDLKLFMIGYQVPAGDSGALKGVVDSSGGNYVEADNKEQLTEVLTSIQQFVQDQNANTVSNVMSTAVAAVGTQNVIAAGTPAAGSTAVLGSGTPTARSTPAPGSTTAPAVTPGGAGLGGTGQTACDHPYFPMRAGSTWSFASDRGTTTWTVSGVTGDQTNASAAMAFNMDKVSGTYNWTCNADGIQSYDFGSFTGAGGTTTVKVTQHSGTWLPSVDKLVTGATWDNSYTLAGDDGSGGTITETFSQHFTLVGSEPHDVAGKTMDTLRIDSTGSMVIAGLATYAYNSTYWLARGVGPVSFSSQFASTSSTSTLTSYSIP